MILVDNKSVSTLSTSELYRLLGISRSTLFAHEDRCGITPSRNNRNARQYNESDILTIMRSLAETMSGNPEYPESLVPMFPEFASLDFSNTDLTIGVLHIISEASK